MSLDRAAVIRNAKQLAVSLGLDSKSVVLSAGSALVLIGLRKTTSDLDVDVPKEFFEKQKARKGAKQGIMGEYVEWDGITDLHPILSESTVQIVTVDHEDIRVYHPEYLLAVKEVMVKHPDRQPDKVVQDWKDIKALKKLLERVEA